VLIIVVVFVTCRLSLSGINELTFCFCFDSPCYYLLYLGRSTTYCRAAADLGNRHDTLPRSYC